jgi:hypothetical protein
MEMKYAGEQTTMIYSLASHFMNFVQITHSETRELVSLNLQHQLTNKILLCLYIIHRLVFTNKTHSVSETGFCFRLQMAPTQLGPIDRASPYLRRSATTQEREYKPSAAQTIRES